MEEQNGSLVTNMKGEYERKGVKDTEKGKSRLRVYQ